jgi:hypothetical protein
VPKKAELYPQRMTEAQLTDRLWARAVELTNMGFTSMLSSEVRAIGREQCAILHELRYRAAQTKLFSDQGRDSR